MVQAVEDELDGDSLSDEIPPNVEFLSCVEFKVSEYVAAADCLPEPLLDKLSNVATADGFSIKDGLFNAYAFRYKEDDPCCKCGRCKELDFAVCLSDSNDEDTGPIEFSPESSFFALLIGLELPDLD